MATIQEIFIYAIFSLIFINKNVLCQENCDPCTNSLIDYCCNINNKCCDLVEGKINYYLKKTLNYPNKIMMKHFYFENEKKFEFKCFYYRSYSVINESFINLEMLKFLSVFVII